MRIVYVASLLTYEGPQLVGRALVRHFQSEHEIRVVGAIAASDHDLHQSRVSDRVLRAEDLDDVDVVYMEGGWTDGSGGATERFPLSLADPYVRAGGQLIAADVDRATATEQRESLLAAIRLFGSYVSHNQQHGDAVCYLHDPKVQEYGGTRLFTRDMTISDNMQMALDGVDSLHVGGAVALTPMGADIAASGNRASTKVLANNEFVDLAGAVPWAMANSFGDGHAVLIGGWVSHDVNLERCPDNARWISNLITLLSDRTRENRQWSAQLPPSGARSKLVPKDLLDAPESQRLERKSSFLVPTDPTRPITPEKLHHAVGKSIAALANTDGGHVIIGQSDERSVLGLAADFQTLGDQAGQDEFTQALMRYIDKNLSHRYEQLKLDVQWIVDDSREVAIIVVPRQPRHIVVHVKNPKTGTEEVYVRRGTQSEPIAGQALIRWVTERR